MATHRALTARQREVFDFIQNWIRTSGYPPTIREIGEHLGIRSTNGVADHLKALKRKGYLKQEGMKSRTLKPVEMPDETDREDGAVPAVLGRSGRTVSLPILGRVAAGEPILAEEQAEGQVVVDSMLVGNGEKVFALKVVGESMIEDGIFNGDFIFVRKKSVADPGAIVVVVIENEATVKRFYPEPEHHRIRLQPANAALSPIYVEERAFRSVQLIGVVVGVYRRL